MSTTETDTLIGYSDDVASRFHLSLAGLGFKFASFLPDSVLHPVNERLIADSSITTVMCSREDEGIATAMGAGWAGMRSVVVMEGSGIGLSANILARGILQRSPTLLLVSHNSVLGERMSYHVATRAMLEPVLSALRVPYHVLRDEQEIELVLQEIVETMEGQRLPVAVLVPRHVLVATSY